jgi:hypothetical protein
MAAAAAASNVLQEVSVEENCIPECYVWPDELVSPMVAHDAFGEEEIPVIDLGGIEEALDHHHEREGDRDQYSSQYLRVVSLLSAACENWESWGKCGIAAESASDVRKVLCFAPA